MIKKWTNTDFKFESEKTKIETPEKIVQPDKPKVSDFKPNGKYTNKNNDREQNKPKIVEKKNEIPNISEDRKSVV